MCKNFCIRITDGSCFYSKADLRLGATKFKSDQSFDFDILFSLGNIQLNSGKGYSRFMYIHFTFSVTLQSSYF